MSIDAITQINTILLPHGYRIKNETEYAEFVKVSMDSDAIPADVKLKVAVIALARFSEKNLTLEDNSLMLQQKVALLQRENELRVAKAWHDHSKINENIASQKHYNPSFSSFFRNIYTLGGESHTNCLAYYDSCKKSSFWWRVDFEMRYENKSLNDAMHSSLARQKVFHPDKEMNFYLEDKILTRN